MVDRAVVRLVRPDGQDDLAHERVLRQLPVLDGRLGGDSIALKKGPKKGREGTESTFDKNICVNSLD